MPVRSPPTLKKEKTDKAEAASEVSAPKRHFKKKSGTAPYNTNPKQSIKAPEEKPAAEEKQPVKKRMYQTTKHKTLKSIEDPKSSEATAPPAPKIAQTTKA